MADRKRETLGAVSRAGEGEQKAHVSQTNIPTFSVDTVSDYVDEGCVDGYPVNILSGNYCLQRRMGKNKVSWSRTDKCHRKEVSGCTRHPALTKWYHTYRH